MPYNRKKPGVAFWATVAVTLLALYLLGVGPARKVSRRNPGVVRDVLNWTYWPLARLHRDGPRTIRDALERYYRLWD